MISTYRSPRRGSISRSRGSSLSKCNMRSLLLSLLAGWILVVIFFVVQLSRSPPSHSPPSLYMNKPHPPLLDQYQHQHQHQHPDPPLLDNKVDITESKIAQKLESQSHLAREQRRIYDDIQLPQLSFSQPREIYDVVKEQFKNADWQPKNAVAKRSNKRPKYKCLYYCDDDLHQERDCVLKHIQYWKKPHDRYENDEDKIHKLFRVEPVLNYSSERYITFKSDCGGFNNLRQAYEFIIGVTWLTQRRLVLPVTEGWYLIDWGEIKIDPPKDTSGVSNYDVFYDMKDLSKVVPVMNLTEFLYKFQDDKEFDLPKQYHIHYDENETTEQWQWRTRQDFKKWQNHQALNKSYAVPYGINHNILLWPSYEDILDSKTSKFSKDSKYYQQQYTLDEYIGHRTKREYFDTNLALHKKEYIHFPSCVDGEMRNYRYLGQVATAIGFADFELELKYKKLLRDHSHLVPKVFEIASFMISYLGLFEYTSAHIRRNDFQFKNSWVAPQKSFENMVAHFVKQEVIYIASDADKNFFANITKEFKQIKAIYRWADFVEKDGKLYDKFKSKYGDSLDVTSIPRKLVALVEMVIAAGATRFFGTTSSTYSAYITRLRGYIDAPDQEVYFHNRGKYEMKKYRPTEYMLEFKDMWLDIKDYC